MAEKSMFSPDFSIIDTDINSLSLYNTLATGKTVLIDFFTTSCGSCGFYAPVIDSIYQNYGSGAGNIEFWGIEQSHNDSLVDIFKTTYGVTNPCASGLQGNGSNVFDIFINQFNLSGTPTYAVVCPNKLIFWDVNFPPTINGFDIFFQACVTMNSGAIENLNTQVISNIYPNPASNYFNIEYNLIDKNFNTKLEIVNNLGVKVQEKSIDSSEKNSNISVNHLQSGIYFVKLFSDNQLIDIKKLNIIK